jgi:hypothetical protein
MASRSACQRQSRLIGSWVLSHLSCDKSGAHESALAVTFDHQLG